MTATEAGQSGFRKKNYPVKIYLKEINILWNSYPDKLVRWTGWAYTTKQQGQISSRNEYYI